MISFLPQTWSPPVLTVSAHDNRGLDEMWDKIVEHRRIMLETGGFWARRGDQAVSWMQDMLRERMWAALMGKPAVAQRMSEIEGEVRSGKRAAGHAVEELVALAGIEVGAG